MSLCASCFEFNLALQFYQVDIRNADLPEQGFLPLGDHKECRIRSRRGRWMPLCTPKGKKRTALLRKLKLVFRSYRSQPVKELIEQINPILGGWVNYFAVDHSSRGFSNIRDWVEKKVRCHLAGAGQRQGFGWKRWSTQWL
jgi:RNA-directed DNA polymerase